jgi:hypothetical protein
VTSLDRMQELLPLPYSVAGDALLTVVLNSCALQVEALEEDVDRMRRSHWIEQAWRDSDLDRLAALVGIRRFPSEPPPLFRRRVVALVRARLRGAIGPLDVRQFVVEYLDALEKELACKLVHGGVTFDKVRLVENPPRVRRSKQLRDRGGRVSQLFRWREQNGGLDPAPMILRITGAVGGTANPVVANLTTKELIGYRGFLRRGEVLVIENGAARIEAHDVSGRLFTIAGFTLGVPNQPFDFGDHPSPSLARGDNELFFAALGIWDERAFDRVAFFPDDPAMREAAFDQTTFDHAIFPAGTMAQLELVWVEHEPASFEVRVPRTIVIEPASLRREFRASKLTRPPFDEIADDLAATLPELRAAGVRAELRLDGFTETQQHYDRFVPGWVVLEPEDGPAGSNDRVGVGARFDETALGLSQFN